MSSQDFGTERSSQELFPKIFPSQELMSPFSTPLRESQSTLIDLESSQPKTDESLRSSEESAVSRRLSGSKTNHFLRSQTPSRDDLAKRTRSRLFTEDEIVDIEDHRTTPAKRRLEKAMTVSEESDEELPRKRKNRKAKLDGTDSEDDSDSQRKSRKKLRNNKNQSDHEEEVASQELETIAAQEEKRNSTPKKNHRVANRSTKKSPRLQLSSDKKVEDDKDSKQSLENIKRKSDSNSQISPLRPRQSSSLSSLSHAAIAVSPTSTFDLVSTDATKSNALQNALQRAVMLIPATQSEGDTSLAKALQELDDAPEYLLQQHLLLGQLSKRRTPYKCNKCGKPKRGHVCDKVDDSPARPQLLAPSSVLASPRDGLGVALPYSDFRSLSESLKSVEIPSVIESSASPHQKLSATSQAEESRASFGVGWFDMASTNLHLLRVYLSTHKSWSKRTLAIEHLDEEMRKIEEWKKDFQASYAATSDHSAVKAELQALDEI